MLTVATPFRLVIYTVYVEARQYFERHRALKIWSNDLDVPPGPTETRRLNPDGFSSATVVTPACELDCSKSLPGLQNSAQGPCSACRSSCSAVLVATNFIVGRCTASAIASASLKSFFCPLL